MAAIKAGIFWIAWALFTAIGSGTLRGDGIALSLDGGEWLPGAGAYGEGWGDVGEGVRVEVGSTLYVRYFATAQSPSHLYYGPHGTNWGAWEKMGPPLSDVLGGSAARPVTLKVTDIGTANSRVSLVNGAGMWIALTRPGPYDLALGPGRQWTLPPLTVAAREQRTWWAALFHALRPGDPNGDAVVSLPDAGQTIVLLGIALASVWAAQRAMRYRRTRRERAAGQRR